MSFECGKVLNLGDLKIIPFKAQNPNLTLNAYGQPLPIWCNFHAERYRERLKYLMEFYPQGDFRRVTPIINKPLWKNKILSYSLFFLMLKKTVDFPLKSNVKFQEFTGLNKVFFYHVIWSKSSAKTVDWPKFSCFSSKLMATTWFLPQLIRNLQIFPFCKERSQSSHVTITVLWRNRKFLSNYINWTAWG